MKVQCDVCAAEAASVFCCADEAALCDACDRREKRGFLFCKEDRAILCRECDVSVHTASELTTRHSRYLLTGVRLSSEPAASPAPPSEEENSSSFCCSADDAGVTRIGGLQEAAYPAWMSQQQMYGGASRELWVPQMYGGELAGSKRSRMTSPSSYSYW
ncbi:hypothetical protein GUJ93_ZPchr0006g46222 [Zizania palustris]|uniref:B box-type domain-containing protein n=1 Tax=Zizania palustris TaxID=103762 RepID=A0A8J5T7T0_ZIZPA|nr:hypothetical protein GUJ93_ZPchr0006g46222 [Zizania palustris]